MKILQDDVHFGAIHKISFTYAQDGPRSLSLQGACRHVQQRFGQMIDHLESWSEHADAFFGSVFYYRSGDYTAFPYPGAAFQQGNLLRSDRSFQNGDHFILDTISIPSGWFIFRSRRSLF